MKKAVLILLATLICCAMLASCGKETTEEPLAVYSFSGENEQFAISNGILVLNNTEEVLYGGDLEETQKPLSDITAYSMMFYFLSGGETKTLLSNAVGDMTGGVLNISGAVGKISGDMIRDTEIDDLKNNLYFELKTTHMNGEENKYQLQMTLTEVTESADNETPVY